MPREPLSIARVRQNSLDLAMRLDRMPYSCCREGCCVEVVGIRGAIVAHENTAGEIGEATALLVRKLLSENGLEPTGIISMFFTMTPDLDAAFPAAAAREVCGPNVPLLCATEIGVPGSLERVIRVLVHAYYPPERGNVAHTYIGKTEILRPDLKRGGRDQ